MWKQRFGWTMVLVAMTAIPAGAAGGWGKERDYSRLADVYIQGVEATVDFTCWDIEWQVNHAASMIENLLYAGKEDKALAVADRILSGIERRSERTIAHIQKSGENLANLLQKNGQTALADEVLAAAAAAVEEIQNAADQAAITLEEMFYIGAE